MWYKIKVSDCMCIIKLKCFPEIIKYKTAVFATQGEMLQYLITQMKWGKWGMFQTTFFFCLQYTRTVCLLMKLLPTKICSRCKFIFFSSLTYDLVILYAFSEFFVWGDCWTCENNCCCLVNLAFCNRRRYLPSSTCLNGFFLFFFFINKHKYKLRSLGQRCFKWNSF